MERTLERIDVFSLAKIVGVIGLLWGVLLAITWLVTGALGGPFPGMPELAISIIAGLISGLIIGGITAILFNATTSLVGGLELDLDG
jgi:hypothetical protein